MTEGQGVVKRLWRAQQRRVALWSPAVIGVGVWLRLGAGVNLPSLVLAVFLLCSTVAAVYARRRGHEAPYLICFAALLLGLGHGTAQWRIEAVRAPVLVGSFKGEVAGRVIEIGRSRSRAPRVVLDHVALAGVHVSAMPRRARITLVDLEVAPPIGSRVVATAVLSAPSGPAAPGAYDFSQQAFFSRIGAVGYARGDISVEVGAEGTLRLARLRSTISQTLQARIDGEAGGVAAALIVGDRSNIPNETTQALRDSGLAHLLAISGLHIGLMSALTFWVVRFALALFPIFASHYPIRKIAAIAGLAAAALYLALAGFGVATQRAFIMAAVAFGAILLDRPAVTARGLAAAACVVLLLRPESLFQAGFQMSFAAVAALIAGYEITRPFWRRRAEDAGPLKRLSTGLIATCATSIIAGLATAPFAAYHFNRLVSYGLPANLLATPLMGLWIMPAIIMTALLAPFGLAGIGLWVLGAGISYILWIADIFSGLDGAAFSVQAAPPLALAFFVFGGLWLVIWQGVLRAFAVIPLALGMALWPAKPRPDLLISEGARLISGRTSNGALWISREKVSGYVAETWLRRDGSADVSQVAAFDRRVWKCTRSACLGETTDGLTVALVRNRSKRSFDRYCLAGGIVVAPKLVVEGRDEKACIVIDRSLLRTASAISITTSDDGGPARVDRATRTDLVVERPQ